jgi:hypothetical protein
MWLDKRISDPVSSVSKSNVRHCVEISSTLIGELIYTNNTLNGITFTIHYDLINSALGCSSAFDYGETFLLKSHYINSPPNTSYINITSANNSLNIDIKS